MTGASYDIDLICIYAEVSFALGTLHNAVGEPFINANNILGGAVFLFVPYLQIFYT